jgi:starch-binding outer membrane protein, SusD/RagB family
MRNTGFAVAAAVLLAACDSPLVTDPTASIDAETALTTARGLELGLNGAYRSLQSGQAYYDRDLLAYPDLYADNLDFTGTFQTDREISLRNVATNNGNVLGAWTQGYIGINRANNVLAAIPDVTGLTSGQQASYRGEALFIRALHLYRLVRWFGDVPLVLEPSRGVGEESLVSRAPAAEVRARIIADLEEAAPLLPTGRVTGRATRGAADALLARVYLEDGKYTEARNKATAVISNAAYSLVSNFATIFSQKNSAESIFELQYSLNHSNALGFWFFPQELGGRWGFSPTAALYNLYEAGDARRAASIAIEPASGKRYINKYFRIANGDDNIPELLLAEMYLVRAEANARLNAPAATVLGDINAIRNRAGATPLLPTAVATQAQQLAAVLHERRLELAFEGHRFFDLRRYGLAQQVLNMAADRLLFPIPQAERDVNTNLTQNPGY